MTLEQLITSALAGGAIPTITKVSSMLRAWWASKAEKAKADAEQAKTERAEIERRKRSEELAREDTGRMIALVADREGDARKLVERILEDERDQHNDCRQVVRSLGEKLFQRQLEYEDRLEAQRTKAEEECQRRVARALEQARFNGPGGTNGSGNGHGGGGTPTDPAPSIFGGQNMDTIGE